MHRCIGTEIKGIVLSPITVGGRFMKRIQDFLVIIQRLYIVQPSLLTREKKKKATKDRGLCSLYFTENGCCASAGTTGSRGNIDY